MEAQIENIQRVRQEVHSNEWYIDMAGIDENSIGLYYNYYMLCYSFFYNSSIIVFISSYLIHMYTHVYYC